MTVRRETLTGACTAATVESLEGRRLLSATIGADKSRLIFNDPTGGSSAAAQTITIRNSGSTSLVIPSNGITTVGTAATKFHITAKPTLPATIAPGGTARISVNFGATSFGPQGAALQIKSNAAKSPTFQVTLRGLGTRGVQGANEPSLQWILETYQIPIRVGDSTPAESTLDSPPHTPNDETVMPLLVRADTGQVTITPIAVFSGVASPALTLGYYRPAGSGVTKTRLYDVPSGDVQTLNPHVVNGSSNFDPGTAAFGLYSTWAAQNNRTVYSEDFRNTFISPASRRRMYRFYPLKNADGSVVANAYVVGVEEAFNGDYQDAVFIIRNVRRADEGRR